MTTSPMFIPSAVTLLLLAAPAPALSQSSSTLPRQADRMVPGTLMFSEAEERLYLERFEKGRAGLRSSPSEAYDPQEPVPGDPDWRPLPQADAGRRTIAPEALAAARDYAAANNSSAFIVWRDGLIEDEAYFGGHAREMPVTSMSLAKPVTTVAVGRAIALGKIKSLDQPVADFITEWQGDPRRSKILVRHILDMRTGYLPQALAPDPTDILNRAYLHPRHDEIIVREYPVVDEPGTRYEYNNATSELAAILIERATGRRYGEFISTEIWKKLGALGGAVWVNRPGGMAHSGCCLMVPAESFLRLAMLFIDDGRWNGQRLLPDGYTATAITPTKENRFYGLGVYVASNYTDRRGAANPDRKVPMTLHGEPYLASDLYLFDGNANQVVYIIPSQRLIVLRTGSAPPRGQGQEWDNAKLPNLVLAGIKGGLGATKSQPR
ncbi:MAG: serine hydrolase [Alphaproteobacteria bacterium]|nr:serine hydrolase [Alphaproteobacteria bacterium]